ncbi:unnamed protein product, partial [Mesorhabditis belari]|uniref:Protein kinase domain-containing protein n=1 Tax=Mesorhabditis belari TaxID=2138241 RepID=A0AAF3FAD4_9BILA
MGGSGQKALHQFTRSETGDFVTQFVREKSQEAGLQGLKEKQKQIRNANPYFTRDFLQCFKWRFSVFRTPCWTWTWTCWLNSIGACITRFSSAFLVVVVASYSFRLWHDVVVQVVWESSMTDSRLFFVIDYVPGGDLEYLVRWRRKIPEDWACFCAAEVSVALYFLHTRGIIHRSFPSRYTLRRFSKMHSLRFQPNRL